jgi:acetyltransferase-like isoleucine patch superfamily enzyme
MKYVLQLIISVYALCMKAFFKTKIALYRRMGAKIGNNVKIFGILDGINPHLIEIGDNVIIGRGSALLAHCPIRGGRGVKIGSNTWLGYGVMVLPGVTIGDHCVIGAGSVVTRDVPPNSIVAGHPARVLRERDKEELERTTRLMRENIPIGHVPRSRG